MAENILGSDSPVQINVPDRPALEGLEEKLSQRWADEKTYAFDENTTREQVYSIDTPPPTASGSCTWVTCSPTPRPTSSHATSA